MVCLSLSIPCLKKSKVTKKGLVVKPVVFSDMNSRAQVDLIDMQSQTGRENKWILVYRDHLTKLWSFNELFKRASEIVYQVLDIFNIFGTPSTLLSANGREFVNSVIEELCSM